jgi:predicted Kef-type K+ transport protein
MIRAPKAGAIYFGLVFAAGFLLGALRVLLVVPLVGGRIAELAEMPIMLLVVYLAARWVTRRFARPYVAAQRLAIGLSALGLLLLLEFTLVLRLRGMTIEDYVESFDPVSGTAYWIAQGLFAVMPLLVTRR